MKAGTLVDWSKTHWPMLRRVLTVGFVVLVVVLLGLAAAKVDWQKVFEAMAHTPPSALWQAALLTVASYLVYACFDLVGKRYTGHDLPWLRCYVIAAVVYAFLMSLGSSVGGLGLRLRLYTRAGLSAGDAARVFGLAVTTNWVGYCLIAGPVFLLGPLQLPTQWNFGANALRVIGGVMILLAIGYVLLCFLSPRREWTVRGHRLGLPSGPLSLLQMGLAVANWFLMGAVLYILMRQQLPLIAVLEVVLLSAVAGLIVRLPAGLGVLETIAVTLLSGDSFSRSEVLACVLAYRAVYYLAPLSVAGLWYLLLETFIRRREQGRDRAPA